MTEVTTRRFGWTVGLSVMSTHCTLSASCFARLQRGVSGTSPDPTSSGEEGRVRGGGREGERGREEGCVKMFLTFYYQVVKS